MYLGAKGRQKNTTGKCGTTEKRWRGSRPCRLNPAAYHPMSIQSLASKYLCRETSACKIAKCTNCLPLISPALVEILIRMTNANTLPETLTLLDVLRMCNLEYSSTREMVVLLLDLIHDFSHLKRTGVNGVVLREERLQRLGSKMTVGTAMRVLWTRLVGGEDLLAAIDVS